MNLSKIKSLFLKILIGCLIAAAALAVITVLVGKFDYILGRSLFTILTVAVYSLVSFSFISNNEKQETFDSLSVFTNATFALIVVSFVSSVLGIWGIFSGELVAKLFAVYFVLIFAILHAEVLSKTLHKQQNIDRVVYTNFCFMLAVVLMLIPVIFSSFSASFGAFYYRMLAALGIIDATLTLVAIILHKLYVQKHPKVNDPVFAAPQSAAVLHMDHQPAQAAHHKRGWNIFVTILIGYVAIQILFMLGVFVMSLVSSSRF